MHIEEPNQLSDASAALSPERERELETLLEEERLVRQNNDSEGSLRITERVISILWEHGDPFRLAAVVKSLSAKRGQLIRTTSEMVRRCMALLSQVEPERAKLAFVEVLKGICEKKIYLEVEYARCAMILVKANEGRPEQLAEAAKVMENVQVETYGSMTKKEKLEFIIYQMKLQLLLGDLTKLAIVGKKVNLKTLDEEGLHLLKVTFYLFMFHLSETDEAFGQCSAQLSKVLEGLQLVRSADELEQVDPVVRQRFGTLLDKAALAESVLLFKCLEDHSATKVAELQALRDQLEVELVRNGRVLALVESLLSRELTTCDIRAFGAEELLLLAPEQPGSARFARLLHKQLVKKNLVIIATYFKNARLERVASLLATSFEEVEESLSELLLERLVKGRIDRPGRLVEFRGEASDEEVLDKWIRNVNEIVDMVDFVCERIEREDVKAK